MSGVLDGVRVLDLSWGAAGLVAGMLLADHGGDVLKIEPPGGDPFRGSPGYDVWLRGRRSVVLDLAEAGDSARFFDLAVEADVLLESFAPGTTARLGINVPTLLAGNSRLVYCSITGYGPVAALADRPGYDALVAARLGILHEQRGHPGGPVAHMNGLEAAAADLPLPEGMAPGAPREGPLLTLTPWLSMAAAYLATVGISAALLARLSTGRGQHVETSLLQAALAVTGPLWQRAEHPDAPGYASWVYDSRATKGIFRCADGRWVQQWSVNPRFVLSSADGEALEVRGGVSDMRTDPARVGPDPDNIVVLAFYYPQMVEAFARFPSDEWVRVAAEAGVPLQTVRTPEEALEDPELLEDGVVAEVPHPERGILRQVGTVYRLSAAPGGVGGPPPRVGQHADDAGWQGERSGVPVVAVRERAGGRPPLDGVLVLDLGAAVAGPFGTQVLADLGADVIKVNAPKDLWWQATHIAFGANRGKRSVGIDLKAAGGREVLLRLVADADVVHSNMRRQAMARLGCDEASLRAVNPELIYCHTRGFDTGPRSDLPGNDQTGCCLAGVTYEDGGGRDGGRPFWSHTSLGDTGNGFLSAIGVIQALYHRARTGVGQRVDTSILNAAMLLASTTALREDGTALPKPSLDAAERGFHPLYRLYRASDGGWLCVAAVTDADWRALVAALSLRSSAQSAAEAAADPELGALLDAAFAERSAVELFALLDGNGVPCEIADADFGRRLFDDSAFASLGLTVRQQHPVLGRFEHFGSTITFSDTPQRIWGPPPLIGQHSREVLSEHGFDKAEIDGLIDFGAVFEERRAG